MQAGSGYRLISFKRILPYSKLKVHFIEYDPNRSSNIARIYNLETFEKLEIKAKMIPFSTKERLEEGRFESDLGL